VRLRLQRIPEEDQQVDVSLGDPRADLLVAAERAALEAGDIEAKLVGEHPPGRVSGEQAMPGERPLVVACPRAQVFLFVVVRYQGDTPASGRDSFPAVVFPDGLSGADPFADHSSILPHGCCREDTPELSQRELQPFK
jgi:hypothetical protein